jgi:hypothetical protein
LVAAVAVFSLGSSSARAIELSTQRTPLVVSGTESPKVRVTLELTSFHEMDVRERDGQLYRRVIPDKPAQYVLRASASEPNHFFVGGYHLETQPMRQPSEGSRYALRVRVARVFGEGGEVEESMGHMDIAGVLERTSEGQVYVLKGASTRVFNNHQGVPMLAIAAGQQSSPRDAVNMGAKQLLSKDAGGLAPAAK